MTNTAALPNSLDKVIKEVFENYSTTALTKSFAARFLNVYDTSEWDESWTSDEGFDEFLPLNESGKIAETEMREGYKVTLSPEQFGLALVISLEMRERAGDDTVKLAKLIAPKNKKMMIAAKNKIERYGHALLNNAFTTTLMADSQPLIGTHIWNSTSYNFTNQISGNPAFSTSAWDKVQEYAAGLTDPTGKENIDIMFNQLIVKRGSDNERAAIRAFGKKGKLYADDLSETLIYEGDDVEIVATPYISTANKNYWFARAKDQENSLAMKFITRPKMHPMLTRENQDYYYAATMTLGAGSKNIGQDWCGSNGAG